ncbi:peptide deformylase [Candidatus Uabimicrobium amorphum]|uniref:Peptide deformylase n=1 Tax=Uabimicrobium amorphum TaxID=2596890 RepID=A0A5S9F3U4_UABAM|nr:peptide deformylase [Candidatus Uabimicrobium amorphum]BBM85115.1 peptide deformylase [Candidatus Uabimicrobium amorphum]
MDVVLYPDPILKKRTEPINEVTEDIVELSQEMIKTMHRANGVGLAGPQVGISKQIIIVNPTAEEGNETIYLNPKILKRKGKEIGEEGCLSFPGVYGNVQRSTWIQVKATLISGEEVTFEAEDFEARVLQHEIDHLLGVLFINKIQPVEQIAIKTQLKELEQKYESKNENA